MKLIHNLKPFHIDTRGEMTYLIENIEASIQSILLITCKKRSVRANHIHKKDSHYSYMLKGSMKYSYKQGKNPVENIIVREGELVYTPPSEAHAMEFLEDSVFL